MVIKNNPLSGEERKIVSTRLYKSEFLYFKKACEREGKKVNTKLREMIREEIEKNPELSKNILIRQKEGIEKADEKIRSKYLIKRKNEI